MTTTEKIIQNNNKKIYRKKNWKVLTKEELLPIEYRDDEDKEFFQIKIILPPKKNYINSYLFSYFPTNIKINFPALIHTTIELDSSRNNIVDDEKGKNRFIIEKLAKFITEVAETLKEENANWKAYEFVNIKHKNEILEKFGFYKIIEKWKETAEIYPCIDNKYRDRNSWKFYSNSFSDFMMKHSEILGDILKRPPFKLRFKYHTDLTPYLKRISQKISSIDERAKFIKHILTFKKNPKIIFNHKELLILINQDKKLKKELFFYNKIFLDLEIPLFVEINYIYLELQNRLNKNELKKIATIREFDIQKDLIKKIIKSNQSIQVKLQALYPLRHFERISISIKGITNKYIRDERILKIFDKKEIIEDYNNLGINNLKELDKFLVWLGAKKFNAQQVLKILVDKNNEKKDISSTLQSLFILKDEFSDNLDNTRIRTSKDIFVLNANKEIQKINELFPYNEDCKKENIIASKIVLGLNNYSDDKVTEFLKWLGIKEFNPQNVTIEKIKQLREEKLNKDEAKGIFQFLYNAKNSNQLPDIKPETNKIYIFNIKSKKLFFRTKLTEKYFDKNRLLFPYNELGFEDNKKSQDFFRWLGVIEADKNLIVTQIFKSDIDVKEKLKDLFYLFKENNSIKHPKIKFKLKSLSGQEKEVGELYINNDITKFFKKEKVVNIPIYEYSKEFFKWLGLKEPSRKQIVKRLLELLTNKNISVKEIKDILSLLVNKYEESDKIDINKPRYLLNNNNKILKTFELYQYDKLAYKNIPNNIICKNLKLDENFLHWIGIKKAEPFEIIRTLLKKKHKNLNDIFELWEQDREIKPLPKNIPIKLLNINKKEVLANKLFLKNSLTSFYDNSEILIDYEQLGLDKSKDIEKFLLWLGVNKYIRYEKDRDIEIVYKIKEIAKLEFKQLFALLEVTNILNNALAKRELQRQHSYYRYWILHNYGIGLINPPVEYENNSKRINLLKQFGVKEDFERKNTLFLLEKLSIIDKKGRYAPLIYKEILNKNFNFSKKEFYVFSKNKEYKNNRDLYYLATSKHPKFILQKYDFIDLPINLDKKEVYNTFGIKELIDIHYTINNFEPIDSKIFNTHFEEIKPYLLAFGSIEVKDIKKKKQLANKLQTLEIKFGKFNCFANKEEIKLEEFEMISSNNIFYIKCKDNINDNFSKNKNLTDSIENILLTINFTSHTKFRDIFRYGDFEELENILSKRYGSTILEDAKDLLKKDKQNHHLIPIKDIDKKENFFEKEEKIYSSNSQKYSKDIMINSLKSEISVPKNEGIKSSVTNFTRDINKKQEILQTRLQ